MKDELERGTRVKLDEATCLAGCPGSDAAKHSGVLAEIKRTGDDVVSQAAIIATKEGKVI